MRLRWDWLEPVVLAPYVPALGPVAPGALTAGMFDDVVAVSGTGRFLPYDKDRRWSDRKDEHVIAGEITHTAAATVIPTLSTTGGGIVKICHYGAGPPDLGALAARGRELCARHGAARHRITWCQQTPDGAQGRLMLKTFTGQDRQGQGPGQQRRIQDPASLIRKPGRAPLPLRRTPDPRLHLRSLTAVPASCSAPRGPGKPILLPPAACPALCCRTTAANALRSCRGTADTCRMRAR